MDEQGTVAVIIPTYNRREPVLRSIRSVLEQTYANLRCIVVDNGSTDGTSGAVESLADDRVTLVARDRPLGAAAARNIGLEVAQGCQWVAFLDSDDLWAPTKLELQLAALTANPAARWSGTACINVGGDLGNRWSAARLFDGRVRPVEGTLVSTDELLKRLEKENVVPGGGSGVLAALDLIVAAGGFRVDLQASEDWELWVRLSRESPLVYVDLPLVAYRIWTTTNVEGEVRTANFIRRTYFPAAGPLPRSYQARWQAQAALRHLAEGRRARAVQGYLRAAWTGADVSLLAYAFASALMPSSLLHAIARAKSARKLPVGWASQSERWLSKLS